jgi:DNA invertase Pin-like site-specific DNA recombinase
VAVKACVYARTSSVERGASTTTIENQIALCRDLARKHNLFIHDYHVFTDVEMLGTLPPQRWAKGDEPFRPALSAMLDAVEAHEVSRVIVRRVEKLGTSSEVLVNLLAFFTANGVRVVIEPEPVTPQSDPRAAFAASILRPCLQFDTEFDEERKAKVRARKLEEIERLKDKIARLEAEIAES